MNQKMSHEEFIDRIWNIGKQKYHHLHPFHLLMHEGKLSRTQIQAWALNRYYYQCKIPAKDALILAKSSNSDFRRQWRKRILDHDGESNSEGGIMKWLKLAEATGLSRNQIESTNEILPGVRFAVDAYITFVQNSPLLDCLAASLTEIFSPQLITIRIEALRDKYPWLRNALSYFEDRLTLAPQDADFTLNWITQNIRTLEDQSAVLRALAHKCDILWAQLDALYFSYVSPGFVPLGAFNPKKEGSNEH